METMPHSRDWRTRQRLTRLHEDAVYIPLTYETNKALYTSELKGVHFGTDQYDVDFASMYFE